MTSKKRICLFGFLLFFFLVAVCSILRPKEDVLSLLDTQYLDEQGGVCTYPFEQAHCDWLSESIGLYLEYLLQTNQKEAFEDAYHVLIAHYMKQDGFIPWKQEENGKKKLETNALIDDLRILKVLFFASEKFHNPDYTHTANTIRTFLLTHQVQEDILTDFYDDSLQQSSHTIHLFYLDIEALTFFPSKQKEKAEMLLKQAPSSPFYPERYLLDEARYDSETNAHMVEQTLTAYHVFHAGGDISGFLSFIKETWKKEKVIYGMYNKSTQTPIVSYDSPAVYALLSLLYHEVGDRLMAEEMNSMLEKKKRSFNENQEKQRIHFFDSIYPYLAETKKTLH